MARPAIGALGDVPGGARLGARRRATIRSWPTAIPGIGDVQVRNRGTLGGRDRPCRSGLGHPGDPARPRCHDRDPLGQRRAGRGHRRLLPGRLRHRPCRGRDPDRDPAAGDARPERAWPTARSSSPPRATRWSAWRPSSAAAGGSVSSARVAITGVADVAYRATAVEQALIGSDGSSAAIDAAAAHATDGQAGQLRLQRQRRVSRGDGRGPCPPGHRSGARRGGLTGQRVRIEQLVPGDRPDPDLVGAVLTGDLQVARRALAEGPPPERDGPGHPGRGRSIGRGRPPRA